MNSIVGAFIGAWAAYFGLFVILPVRYTSVEVLSAGIVLGIYVVASVACFLAFQVTTSRSNGHLAATTGTARPLDELELGKLIMLGLGASVIGLMFIAYVRVVVQGIDFSQGIAVARELWRSQGEERSGISSILSIPGYGLGFFFLASTFIGHLHWEHLPAGIRRALIVGTLVLLAAHSVLTGGRTILLIQVVSMIAAGSVRRTQGRAAFPGGFWRAALFASASIIIAGGYFLYVFSERARAGGISPETYSQAALSFMGAAPTDAFYGIAGLQEPLAAAAYFATIAGAYATHSIGTLASVTEYTSRPGVAFFVGPIELLSRVGMLTKEDTSWVLGGAFLSLPGALWYDYGLWGVVAGAVLTGAALALVYGYARRCAGGAGSVCFSSAALITAILSPLIFAPDSLAFPFMLLGFLGLAAYARGAFGVRNWWLVGRECSLTEVTLAR